MANIFDNDKIWNRPLDEIMSESFGKYAKYIIQDRALPDIRDGLKPVQRRILHAMNELKIYHNKPFKKSARTVGEVIGKYHPHGDISIYEAMVRMSQEWKNNIPLLDMQGNKGSIDGDSPAAMRYTECRLSKYGELLLEDIEKETVKFIFNFDDSEQEPSILPSLIPNVLINGSTGIAAGYATNIPPFNINEILDAIIYKIRNKNADLNQIANIVKGPDFPTGGIIQGRDGILDIYKTGRGKFNIRGKFLEIERNTNKKHKQLIITELPYEINKASLVKSIDEIRINGKLPGLKEVRDDSDKNGISIMLDFDTDKSLDVLKNYLYKNTQMQISYSANIVLIKDRKPFQLGIIEIINAYLDHANDIVIKAAQYDLNKALARKEILEGLIKAISEIDQLVTLIKSSDSKDEAKNKLINYFKINERQAEAVVQLRLYILTSYDTQKLKEELVELLELIEYKSSLINNSKVRDDYLIDRLEYFKNALGQNRKTIIEDEIQDISINETDVIEEKHGIAIVTRDNYIKFINYQEIKDVDLDKLNIKDSDIPVEIFNLSTLDTLICFTNKGKCINIPAHKIKMTKLKDKGIHINDIVTIDSADKAITAFAITKRADMATQIVIATKKSLIKRITLEELTISKSPRVSSYIGLRNDDEVVSAFVIKNNFSEIATVSENGMAIRYSINEIPLVGRTASGVKNINLKDKDLVAASFAIDRSESFVLIASNRGVKRIYFDDITLSSRTKTGKKIFAQVDSNPYIVNSAFVISGRQTINVLAENGNLFFIRASDVPISDSHSRMSKYPEDIDLVSKVSVIDIKRNTINELSEEYINALKSEKQKELDSKLTDEKIDLDSNNIVEEESTLDSTQKNNELEDIENNESKKENFGSENKENIIVDFANEIDKHEDVRDENYESHLDDLSENFESIDTNVDVENDKDIEKIIDDYHEETFFNSEEKSETEISNSENLNHDYENENLSESDLNQAEDFLNDNSIDIDHSTMEEIDNIEDQEEEHSDDSKETKNE